MREQFFLVSADQISRLVDAIQIRPTDRVVELGAGAGTVARELPPCRRLTLIELDARLIPLIGENVPQATQVIQGDALQLIREIPCDVLIGSLPTKVTERLFEILPRLTFRTAVLAVGEGSDLSGLEADFVCSEVTRISGNDFRPRQPSISRIVKLSRR
jgi:16S rRNA A1518/A1519 N6-dimethyltransferase RsmA/KsgA/DIM1 with predicted DNA glycosylase/AP lyase activity